MTSRRVTLGYRVALVLVLGAIFLEMRSLTLAVRAYPPPIPIPVARKIQEPRAIPQHYEYPTTTRRLPEIVGPYGYSP